MIPLHQPVLKKNDFKIIKKVIESKWVSSAGPDVKKFENKICKFTKSAYAIACINGTSALHIALKLSNVEKNDEVLVPSLTFIASVNAINYNNAIPVFLDSNDHYLLDTNKLLDFLKKKTKTIKKNKKIITININSGRKISAIILVHVFGFAVDIEKIVKLCKEKNISVIEDAAESLGTFYNKGKFKGHHTGTIGKFGILSFNGNKIITSGGGGMILTQNQKLAKKVKYLTTQAKDDKINFIHNEVGYNYRLSNIHAALGISQLNQINNILNKKSMIHNLYKKFIINKNDYEIISGPIYCNSNYWLNILKIKNKKISIKKIISIFAKNNIEVRPIWLPNHLQKPYKSFEKYKLVNTNKLLKKTLCLPSSSNLKMNQIKKIIKLLP